jgi:hypothetical protein
MLITYCVSYTYWNGKPVKESVVTYSKVNSDHVREGTEENHKILRIACLWTDVLTRNANHSFITSHKGVFCIGALRI